MASVTSPAALTLTGGVLVGLGVSGGSFTIVIAAFARLVEPATRSWAMGLATAAGSMGQFLFAPLGQGFIDAYGPPTALLLLSCTLLFVPLLARSLTGRGDDADEPGERLSAREALRRRGRAPELPAADERLLRLRLPHRLHHHAHAGVPDRPG